MKLKTVNYAFIIFLSLNFCATNLLAKKTETKIAEANSLIISNIQNIYTNEYQNKIGNIESIFTLDELKTLEPKLLLNKYYEINKSIKNYDNKAFFEINQEIDKFYKFINDVKTKIDTEIRDNEIKIRSMKRYKKISYSFDHNLIPTEIKENISDLNLKTLLDKENNINDMGLDYEKNLYYNHLEKNKKYQENQKQIDTKLDKKVALYNYTLASSFYMYDPYYMPDNIKNRTLSTDEMIVLQVIPNGILAIQNIPQQYYELNGLYYSTWNQIVFRHKGSEYPAIFIKTNKSFIVGQRIKEHIRYSGKNFTYPTTYGTTTVMVFNIVTDYSQKLNQYFSLEKEIENLQKQQLEIEENIKKDFYFYK